MPKKNLTPPPKPELFQEMVNDHILGNNKKSVLSARFYNTHGRDLSMTWELKEKLRNVCKEK